MWPLIWYWFTVFLHNSVSILPVMDGITSPIPLILLTFKMWNQSYSCALDIFVLHLPPGTPHVFHVDASLCLCFSRKHWMYCPLLNPRSSTNNVVWIVVAFITRKGSTFNHMRRHDTTMSETSVESVTDDPEAILHLQCSSACGLVSCST